MWSRMTLQERGWTRHPTAVSSRLPHPRLHEGGTLPLTPSQRRGSLPSHRPPLKMAAPPAPQCPARNCRASGCGPRRAAGLARRAEGEATPSGCERAGSAGGGCARTMRLPLWLVPALVLLWEPGGLEALGHPQRPQHYGEGRGRPRQPRRAGEKGEEGETTATGRGEARRWVMCGVGQSTPFAEGIADEQCLGLLLSVGRRGDIIIFTLKVCRRVFLTGVCVVCVLLKRDNPRIGRVGGDRSGTFGPVSMLLQGDPGSHSTGFHRSRRFWNVSSERACTASLGKII